VSERRDRRDLIHRHQQFAHPRQRKAAQKPSAVGERLATQVGCARAEEV
jgi:hypothetical protein